MTTPLSGTLRLLVGDLPEPGRLPDPQAHPFETVRPTRDGFVDMPRRVSDNPLPHPVPM